MRSRWVLGLAALALGAGCRDVGEGLDPANPARGPGQYVGNGEPITDGNFHGGEDPIPVAAAVAPPLDFPIECDSACRAYCDGLGLENPVNVGACPSTWGVGLSTQPLDRTEACRRLYADMVGRFPLPSEVNDVCDRPTWGETVSTLLATDEFVRVQRKRWSDALLYNNRAVNFERTFDMDDLVRKTYEGRVPWDLFAAVTSAHPVLVRRYDTAGDRAEALFNLFLGRPPYLSERADIARLYALWINGYWDHPYAGRLPDAFIRYRCLDEAGAIDPATSGECTSIEWGFNQLVLFPDERVEPSGDQAGMMWSGYLTVDEWEQLQLPGRVVAAQPRFWEHAVDTVAAQYLGYDLGTTLPEVRHELVEMLLRYDGDIRSVHYAVATSALYLQSSRGGMSTPFRWTYGPLKQLPAEGWIDTIRDATGISLSRCDHRLPHPDDLLDPDGDPAMENGIGWLRAMVRNTEWELEAEGDAVVGDYRSLARILGGCPANEIGGSFTTVSILNTAVQENFVAEVCDPALLGEGRVADVESLLPDGVVANTALDESVALAIVERQTRLFFGREPTEEELERARAHADACTPKPCTAESFARPVCFALLSSSEMLFY